MRIQLSNHQVGTLRYEVVFAILVKEMKREPTRENVNNPRTRRKFLVMWIKSRKYFIESIIHINIYKAKEV